MFAPVIRLLRERDVNAFLSEAADAEGYEFVERVLDYFDASYNATGRDLERFPAEGPVVVLPARSPGLLEAALLLKALRQVRPDVRLVANARLLAIAGLRPLLVPRESVPMVLQRDEAVIASTPDDVPSDTAAAVLPLLMTRLEGAHFRGWTAFFRRDVVATLRLGEPLLRSALEHAQQRDKPHALLTQMARSGPRVVGFGADRRTPIARPEDRLQLRREIERSTMLGTTHDGKRIVLFDYVPDCAVLRELGRLREVAFRQAGEGTGKRRDNDRFDLYYRHVVVWDDADLQIVGAYRVGEAARVVDERGEQGLYTHTLFEYSPALRARFGEALELGRSFVQPRYQGLRALDLLWQGIGAYLRAHAGIRYLFGPVSISAAYPRAARMELVAFFRQHFGVVPAEATARRPFDVDVDTSSRVASVYADAPYAAGVRILKDRLATQGLSIPILYKQYSELCEPGGTRFLAFSVDPSFGHCVDGLVWVDLACLKAAKRARYLDVAPASPLLRKSA
jgi:putative hemolysin